MRTFIRTVGAVVAVVLMGCGATDASPSATPEVGGSPPAGLVAPLDFLARTPSSDTRLVVQPNGSATGQRNLFEPIEFTLDADELQEIVALVDRAAIADQDEDVPPADEATEESVYAFEYGDVTFQAAGSGSSPELVDLAVRLQRLVTENLPQGELRSVPRDDITGRDEPG